MSANGFHSSMRFRFALCLAASRTRWKPIRRVGLLAAEALLVTLPAHSLYANCSSYGLAYAQGLTNYFQSCGGSNAAFVWFHGRGVQRIIGPETVPNQGNTTSGHDSANRFPFADGLIGNGADAGFPAGSLLAGGDPGNQGWDGCILNIPERRVAGCGGSPDYGVMDYTLGGIDPAFPNIGRVAAVSVDFNPILLAWLADNAGAPAGDGTCLGDALSGNPNPIICGELPVPNVTVVTPVPAAAS